MLDTIPASMLKEWEIFSELEGLRENRADGRTGWLAMVVANSSRRSKTAKIFRAAELTPVFGDAPAPTVVAPKADWQRMKAIGQAMTQQSQEAAARIAPERFKGRTLTRNDNGR